jgi:hypothetical protein
MRFVAQELVDVTAEAGDHRGGRLLVLGRDPMPLLGIEVRRDRGRADQVAEQCGEVPALAVGGRGWWSGWGGGLRRGV